MSRYRQLSIEERCSIARLHEDGQSIRQIASALDRQPSTIARELKRNSGSKVGYQPAYAQAQTDARRWTGARLERDDRLREEVLDRLACGWSPEQVAGRLAHEQGHRVISHETIYRFVYAQLKRTNDRRWRFYLPRAKYKRGWRTKGGWPRYTDRPSIHARPDGIEGRRQAGHWEADVMLFSTPGQAILLAHERHSRITIALPQSSLKADPVADALVHILNAMPPWLRRSITFDNPVLSACRRRAVEGGTEFTRHRRIEQQLGLNAYFCDPHAPMAKRRRRKRHRQAAPYLAKKNQTGKLVPQRLRRHHRKLQ